MPSGPILPAVSHQEWNGIHGRLHYVEAGSGAPILLLHGGHGAWVHWMANIDALAERCRVIAPDLPGFGDSWVPEHRLELPAYADVISDFIDGLRLRNVALAGFSFGTLVASATAALRPDVVTSLTLINPPGIGERSVEGQAIPARLAQLAKQQGLHAGVTGTLRELMLFDQSLVTPELIDLIASCVERTRFETRSLSRIAQTVAVLETLPQAVQVLLGEQDPYHRHELEGRRERIRHARSGDDCVRIVPRAAHWLQYDRSDYFNQALLDFIAG